MGSKLCKSKMTDMTALTQAKDLFCNQGSAAVQKDPTAATKLLKSATDVLKKSGNPQAQQLSTLRLGPLVAWNKSDSTC